MAFVNVTGLLVVDERGPAEVKHAKFLVREALWRVWQAIAPDLCAEGEVDWETAMDCCSDKYETQVRDMRPYWRKADAALEAWRMLTMEEQDEAGVRTFKGKV